MYEEEIQKALSTLISYYEGVRMNGATCNAEHGNLVLQYHTIDSHNKVRSEHNLSFLFEQLEAKGFSSVITKNGGTFGPQFSFSIAVPDTMDSLLAIKNLTRDKVISDTKDGLKEALDLARYKLGKIMPANQVERTFAEVMEQLNPPARSPD